MNYLYAPRYFYVKRKEPVYWNNKLFNGENLEISRYKSVEQDVKIKENLQHHICIMKYQNVKSHFKQSQNLFLF